MSNSLANLRLTESCFPQGDCCVKRPTTHQRRQMTARLGQVFYRVACGIAALITVFLMSGPPIGREAALMMMVSGGVIWLIGRACHYLLAGR